jgi:hypothetical protein
MSAVLLPQSCSREDAPINCCPCRSRRHCCCEYGEWSHHHPAGRLFEGQPHVQSRDCWGFWRWCLPWRRCKRRCSSFVLHFFSFTSLYSISIRLGEDHHSCICGSWDPGPINSAPCSPTFRSIWTRLTGDGWNFFCLPCRGHGCSWKQQQQQQQQ